MGGYTIGKQLSGPLWEKALRQANHFYKTKERGTDAYYEYAEKIYNQLKKKRSNYL